MLQVECQDYLDEVFVEAKRLGLKQDLDQQLDWLGNYTCPPDHPEHTRCRLYKDFAPLSFAFAIDTLKDGEYKFWFNGGLIFYRGSESGVGSPQFSVSLSRSNKSRWEVHT